MKSSFAIFWGASTLLVMSQLVWSLPTYEIDDNSAHGVRFSANDQFSVIALNNIEYFVMSFPPYEFDEPCVFEYISQNFYVYSLAATSNNDNITSFELYKFFLVGEYTNTQDVYIMSITINRSTCGMSQKFYRTNLSVKYLQIIENETLFYNIHS
jgi:hypothetical protein